MSLQDSRQRSPFRRCILSWYDLNKRALPWRENRDPYRIWISEIMLQQTRVAAVIDYYQAFLKKFPNVEALAAARLDSVLAAWSGLGYYRRARMLHEAAGKVTNEYGGVFPRSAEGLRELPGIGRYTAAAIASIAFDEPVAVVDGNVERVLSRLLGRNSGGDQAWAVAQELLSPARPGDFNQAMMELGATVCIPGEPKCLACPVMKLCATRGQRTSEGKAKRVRREIYYALNRQDDRVLLVKRPASVSLMPGMWELPEIVTPNGEHPVSFTVRHSITVTDYVVRVTFGPAMQNGISHFSPKRRETGHPRWVTPARLKSLPLTGLTRKILRRANII